MLWFQKKSEKRKKRRRRSSGSRSSDEIRRPDPSERGSRSRTSSSRSRHTPRARLDSREGPRREDTRDRDIRRKIESRERVESKEQEEVFAAVNFDGEAIKLDSIDRAFGRALTTSLYILLGLLVLGLVSYGISRAVKSSREARVVPLQKAAASGDIDELRALISRNGPVNGVGPDGGTPLASAIRADNIEAAQMLLDSGATPSDYAMRMAVRYERWDILASLVRAGGNTEVRGTWDGRSPLELAVERRDMDMIRLLLEYGADAGAITNEGPVAEPALHYAAEHGMKDVVKLLLEHGADPRRSWMGYLPRHIAENQKHDEVAKLLAEAEGAMRDAGIPEE